MSTDEKRPPSKHDDQSVEHSVEEGYIQSRGVTRMEAIQCAAKSDRTTIWLVSLSVIVCAWAYSLDQSTTSNYDAFATSSFGEHSSGLAALSIATSIISSVCKPFIAKISDMSSRPSTYILVLTCYVVGYIIIAACTTISAYVVGQVAVSIGAAGLDLLNNVIVGDLTPLQWRGFVSSVLSAPYIINTWFSGKIVSALSEGEKWRWGYGMFAIIMPVVLTPAIVTLMYLERKAKKAGIVNIASSPTARRAAREKAEKEGYKGPDDEIIDAFGLVLLGFGWSLLLLPFSLKTYAKGGWNNRKRPLFLLLLYSCLPTTIASMIAMMVVGGVILILYVVWERFFAIIPSSPRRLLLNKTFMMAIVIDFFYEVAGDLRGLYFSSYVYIVTDMSTQNWTYFNNTLTLSLCVFGLIAGLIQRWTHRYKALQIFGLCVKIIGIGILLQGTRATARIAQMAMSMVLVGAGGAFSVVGSRVASQASVPHQDLALVIALLSLWSKIGASIGSAVAAVIWSAKMPQYLREYLPANVTDAQVETFFGNIRAIREYDIDDPIRQGAIRAYQKTLWFLIVPAVSLSFIPLIAACFQTNFYLGKRQNAVMDIGVDGRRDEEVVHETEEDKPLTKTDKFLRFWAGRK
ncbi:MFS general substrate transporter [Fistulina hepatica ATCC 64428]|nr:MFS general substrate transporter [Fistulina hepatica ATCC 64428]